MICQKTKWRADAWVFLLFVLLSSMEVAAAQASPASLKIDRSHTSGRVLLVRPADGKVIAVNSLSVGVQARPIDFFHQYGELFGVRDPGSQLTLRKETEDRTGRHHAMFKQFHRGVPVFAGEVRVHRDRDRKVYAVNGEFFPVPAKLSVDPLITQAEAEVLAAGELAALLPKVESIELTIVDPGWYGDPSIGARLAWYVIVSDQAAAAREAMFIDARDGSVLDRWSLIKSALVRQINDAEGTEFLTAPPLLTVRNENDPPSGIADADAAYDYLDDFYAYYFNGFGRDGAGGLGAVHIATINHDVVCPNARWYGIEAPAPMTAAFCAGVVADDVVAHEYTHGVIEATADLIYQNQSGMLNESFADIFGELIDRFNGNAAFIGEPGDIPWPLSHPTGPGTDVPNDVRTGCSPEDPSVRWLIAEDATAFGGAIRDMWDPTCFCDPDRADSPLWICSESDQGGVHSGSGIPNHAFAMLVDRKTFGGVLVRRIGPIRAAAVWYKALTQYLTPSSDFQAAYLLLNQAAQDLIGTYPIDPRTGAPGTALFSSQTADRVDVALRAVGLDSGGSCSTTGDCNDNTIEDACEIATGRAQDCNGNGLPDECDLDGGTSEDCNLNEIPDECEAPSDCNANGLRDECEVPLRTDSYSINGVNLIDTISCGLAEGGLPGAGLSFNNWVSSSGTPQASEPWCNGLTDPGFQWTDILDPTRVVTGVTLDLNIGVECDTPGLLHQTEFNGEAGPDFAATSTPCDCGNGAPDVVPVNVDPVSYVLGGTNEFRVVNLAECFGFRLPQYSGQAFEVHVSSRHVDDCDADEVPDECETDSDGDGLQDDCDSCPFDAADDGDGDGLCADSDNCSEVFNPDQADGDADGTGDACDSCPGDYDPAQIDCDGDQLGDACDPDTDDGDGDGIDDACDNCPDDANPDQADGDGDGTGNACESSGGGGGGGGGGRIRPKH